MKFKREAFTITRGGKPIAHIGPVEGLQKAHVLGELREMLQSLPRLGDEAERYWKDVREAIHHQPSLPEEG